MHHLLPASLILCLACSLSAQVDDKFEIYPARNSASSTGATRPAPVTTSGIEFLQEVPGKLFSGVGDDNTGGCSATAFTMMTQDQNQATQETFNVVFRKNLAAGGPDASVSGLILRTGDITLWGAGSGLAAANFTLTFTTPVVIPCSGGFSCGIEFRAAPQWTTDGQSIWYADYAAGTAGDNPRSGAPKHTFLVSGGSATATSASQVLAVAIRSKAPCTNLGNFDPGTTRIASKISYGAGGMYPAIKAAPRDDGLMLRLIDTPNLGGSGHTFMSVGIGSFGFPFLPGVFGHIWLPLTPLIYIGSFPINDDGAGVGVGTLGLANPGAIPSSPGIILGFTTITINAGFANPRISNAQGVVF